VVDYNIHIISTKFYICINLNYEIADAVLNIATN